MDSWRVDDNIADDFLMMFIKMSISPFDIDVAKVSYIIRMSQSTFIDRHGFFVSFLVISSYSISHYTDLL